MILLVSIFEKLALMHLQIVSNLSIKDEGFLASFLNLDGQVIIK